MRLGCLYIQVKRHRFSLVRWIHLQHKARKPKLFNLKSHISCKKEQRNLKYRNRFCLCFLSNLKIFSVCNGKKDACPVVVVDIMVWWMDVLAVQGEFAERFFGGGSDLVVIMAIRFWFVWVWIKGFHGEN